MQQSQQFINEYLLQQRSLAELCRKYGAKRTLLRARVTVRAAGDRSLAHLQSRLLARRPAETPRQVTQRDCYPCRWTDYYPCLCSLSASSTGESVEHGLLHGGTCVHSCGASPKFCGSCASSGAFNESSRRRPESIVGTGGAPNATGTGSGGLDGGDAHPASGSTTATTSGSGSTSTTGGSGGDASGARQ